VIGTQKTATLRVPDATDSFHVYAIEWDASRIRWFVDDRQYFEFPHEAGGRDVWPFDRPFHVLVNIAVGGTWGGQQGIDDESMPFRMEVDYVRVYR
jgi:beta-glucanase (GH16 family)